MGCSVIGHLSIIRVPFCLMFGFRRQKKKGKSVSKVILGLLSAGRVQCGLRGEFGASIVFASFCSFFPKTRPFQGSLGSVVLNPRNLNHRNPEPEYRGLGN